MIGTSALIKGAPTNKEPVSALRIGDPDGRIRANKSTIIPIKNQPAYLSPFLSSSVGFSVMLGSISVSSPGLYSPSLGTIIFSVMK
jgi:hypothetical protein